jgi:hypothetical protein
MRSTSEVYSTGKFGDIPFRILRLSQGKKSETLSTSTFFEVRRSTREVRGT